MFATAVIMSTGTGCGHRVRLRQRGSCYQVKPRRQAGQAPCQLPAAAAASALPSRSSSSSSSSNGSSSCSSSVVQARQRARDPEGCSAPRRKSRRCPCPPGWCSRMSRRGACQSRTRGAAPAQGSSSGTGHSRVRHTAQDQPLGLCSSCGAVWRQLHARLAMQQLGKGGNCSTACMFCPQQAVWENGAHHSTWPSLAGSRRWWQSGRRPLLGRVAAALPVRASAATPASQQVSGWRQPLGALKQLPGRLQLCRPAGCVRLRSAAAAQLNPGIRTPERPCGQAGSQPRSPGAVRSWPDSESYTDTLMLAESAAADAAGCDAADSAAAQSTESTCQVALWTTPR